MTIQRILSIKLSEVKKLLRVIEKGKGQHWNCLPLPHSFLRGGGRLSNIKTHGQLLKCKKLITKEEK